MTGPAVMPQFAADINSHYTRLRSRFAPRHNMQSIVHEVRQGRIRELFPDELNFSLSFHGSPVANFIDNVAHDMAEGIAPLPALACVSGRMQSDADLARAEKKNRIGDNYWRHSNLAVEMLKAADRYVTYGFLPIFVEPDPDIDCMMPYIHLENPRYAVYEKDRYGRVTVYGYKMRKSIDELCSMFPEYQNVIRENEQGKQVNGDVELEMLRWVDKQCVTILLPERRGLVLDRYEHKLKRAPVWVAERPGEDDDPRGQFDDVIWVQIARSIFSTLALEAAAIAVQAPIAVPDDMDELSYGPHAILQSQNAKDIHKVNLELPPQIFAEGQQLDQELRNGARYPEARQGNPGTSVITGKGVQALLGSFDSQIKGAQLVFKTAFEQITAMCFEMDEVWWPDDSKTVTGTISGASYELAYVPSKDINGRYACTVTYGFAAGLAPEQSIITMLQLEGAGLIAKGTTQENLPFGIDQIQEARKIHVEQSREALLQGVFSLVQASGQMAGQGQDPMPIVNMVVEMIRQIEDGETVENAIAAAYTSMQQAQQEKMEAQAGAQDQEGQGDQDPMAALMGGGAPPSGGGGGGAPAPQGGPPMDLQQMISGLRGNGSLPVMSATTKRMNPAVAG